MDPFNPQGPISKTMLSLEIFFDYSWLFYMFLYFRIDVYNSIIDFYAILVCSECVKTECELYA